MKPDGQATFFLDGVTFQMAGELFFETEKTRPDQLAYPASYHRSLEDFARALVFGRGVAVGRHLPEVAPGVLPGDQLRNYLGTTLAHPVDNAGQGGQPDDLLNDSNEKLNVGHLIPQLSRIAAMPRDFVFWKELAVRESRHIGTHSSLNSRLTNPDDYRYDKRFNQDSELRTAVPDEYLDPLIAFVRNSGNIALRVNDDALRIFYAENAVTHILTFCWYRKFIPYALGESTSSYQPHATRSSIIPPGAMDVGMELPDILKPILQKADRPIDVLDELLYAALRKL